MGHCGVWYTGVPRRIQAHKRPPFPRIPAAGEHPGGTVPLGAPTGEDDSPCPRFRKHAHSEASRPRGYSQQQSIRLAPDSASTPIGQAEAGGDNSRNHQQSPTLPQKLMSAENSGAKRRSSHSGGWLWGERLGEKIGALASHWIEHNLTCVHHSSHTQNTSHADLEGALRAPLEPQV